MYAIQKKRVYAEAADRAAALLKRDDASWVFTIGGVAIARMVDLCAERCPLEWSESAVADQIVAGAPLAGPIALHNVLSSNEITVYNSRGGPAAPDTSGPLCVSEMQPDEKIRALGWNNATQHLMILGSSGSLAFRAADGVETAAATARLPGPPVQWAAAGHGFCVFTETGQLCMATCLMDGDEYNVRSYPGAATGKTGSFKAQALEEPSAMAVLPADKDVKADTTILVSNGDGGESRPENITRVVWRAGGGVVAQVTTSPTPPAIDNPVLYITPRPDNKALAFLLLDGAIVVTNAQATSTLHVVRCDAELGMDYQLEWLGTSALALIVRTDTTAEAYLFHLGAANPSEAMSAPVPLPRDAVCIWEPDGLRILCGADYAATAGLSGHMFLQVVPQEVVDFYSKADSSSPERAPFAALLRKAYIEMLGHDAGCARALQYLSQFPDRFAEALRDVLDVACFEWAPERQQEVLRVVSYGKAFCPLFDAGHFVSVCQRLRVLHALRHDGRMLLSARQLTPLEGDPLTRRLIAQRLLPLACDIAELLGYNKSAVLERWALSIVERLAEGQMGIKAAVERIAELLQRGNFDLTPAVNKAKDSGLYSDAVADLIGLERSHEKRIQMYQAHAGAAHEGKFPGFTEAALSEAARSGDSDVMFDCLMRAELSRDALARLGEQPELQAMATLIVRFAAPLALESSSRINALQEVLCERDPLFSVALSMTQYYMEAARLRAEVARLPAAPAAGAKDKAAPPPGSSRVDAIQGTLATSVQGAAITLQHTLQLQSHAAATPLAPGASRDGAGAFRGFLGGAMSNTQGTAGAAGAAAAAAAGQGSAEEAILSGKEVLRRLNDQGDLLREQQVLYESTRSAGFLNASLAATLRGCVDYDMSSKADKLAQKFGASERTLYWARLLGLLQRGQRLGNWLEVEKQLDAWFGKNSKTPVTPHAVATALIEANQARAAGAYIQRVPSIVERLELWVTADRWGDAAMDIRKSGDADGSKQAQLRRRAGTNRAALAAIDQVFGGGR